MGSKNERWKSSFAYSKTLERKREATLVKRLLIIRSFKCAHCGGPWIGGFEIRPYTVVCSEECRRQRINKTRKPYAEIKDRPHVKAYRQKRKLNIQWRLSKRLRGRLREMLKGCKAESALRLLGCSIHHFKNHIQESFQKGMAWNNYGTWHIDHIQPCASFDLSNEYQRRVCFHWSNMRPMWATKNIAKGDKIIIPQLHLPI